MWVGCLLCLFACFSASWVLRSTFPYFCGVVVLSRVGRGWLSVAKDSTGLRLMSLVTPFSVATALMAIALTVVGTAVMGVAAALVAAVAAVTAVVTAVGSVVTALVAVLSTIWVVITAFVTAFVTAVVTVLKSWWKYTPFLSTQLATICDGFTP